MKRHDMRLNIVNCIYQHLLLNKELSACFDDNFTEELLKDEFIITIEEDLKINEENYIKEISNHLRKWSFDRLNLIDQAILLLAISELKTGLNNRRIIINEAIEIAKEYCDDNSYRYINGVLDNL